MKNQVEKFLKSKAEVSRQLMVIETVLFVVAIMSVAVIQTGNAATDDTNMAQTVTAGAITVVSPTQLNFNDGTFGETTIANINGTDTGNTLVVSDLRGTRVGWNLTGFWNANWVSNGAVQMDINNAGVGNETTMVWYPTNMTITNNTGDNAEVQNGADANFDGIESGNALTLINTTTTNNNGAGIFDLDTIEFKYTIPSGAVSTDYTANFQFTLL